MIAGWVGLGLAELLGSPHLTSPHLLQLELVDAGEGDLVEDLPCPDHQPTVLLVLC
jgi:hypothetical protein